MSITRLAGFAVVVIVGGVTATACSSRGESAGQTSEASRFCPAWGCYGPPPICYDDPGCSGTATTWDKVDQPWLGFDDASYAQGAALKAEMIAAGCTSPMTDYVPCQNGTYFPDGTMCTASRIVAGVFPIAICPRGYAADIDAMEIPCDQCTRPPDRQHLVVQWKSGPEVPGGCHRPPCGSTTNSDVDSGTDDDGAAP